MSRECWQRKSSAKAYCFCLGNIDGLGSGGNKGEGKAPHASGAITHLEEAEATTVMARLARHVDSCGE